MSRPAGTPHRTDPARLPSDDAVWGAPFTSYREWARAYGVNEATVQRHLTARGWVRSRHRRSELLAAPCRRCGASQPIEALDAARECRAGCEPMPAPAPAPQSVERAPISVEPATESGELEPAGNAPWWAEEYRKARERWLRKNPHMVPGELGPAAAVVVPARGLRRAL